MVLNCTTNRKMYYERSRNKYNAQYTTSKGFYAFRDYNK